MGFGVGFDGPQPPSDTASGGKNAFVHRVKHGLFRMPDEAGLKIDCPSA
jgi:hypothetical protein